MESRGYHQHCGLARALDRVGDRWTLLMIRDLLLGPRRYSQFMDSLQGITTNLLAKKLKALEQDQIIEKHQGAYRLTPLGAALEPAIMELARWGGNFMNQPQPQDRKNLAWALISCKRRYQGGQEFRVGIHTDEGRHFEMLFEKDRLWVQERDPVDPHLSLSGPEQAFFPMLFQDDWQGIRITQKPGALEEWSKALNIRV